MHYRHHYHAGNFADVFKHLLLIGLIQALNRKDKPWFFLDTHAGAGSYDLRHDIAAKTAEWRDGIGRLAGLSSHDPVLAEYLRLAADPARYPGSPLIAAALARPGDRLALCEKVPEVAEALDRTLRSLPRGENKLADWAVHHRDGYEAASLLPPKEKRGLVLIDPPFERSDEFDAIAELIASAQGRFAQGQYVAWYPVKNRFEADRFVRRVARDSARPVLDVRFDNGEPAEGQMHVCGMLVVNPPFRLLESLQAAFDEMRRHLALGSGAAVTSQWLKTEDQCLRN